MSNTSNEKKPKNEAGEKVMSELAAILETPIPLDMVETVRRFVEIISVLQGQIEGLCDTVVEQEIRIRSLDRGLGKLL